MVCVRSRSPRLPPAVRPRGKRDMPSSFERLRDYVGTAMTLGSGPRAAAAIPWRQTKNLLRLHLARCRPNTVYAVDTIYGPLLERAGQVGYVAEVVLQVALTGDSIVAWRRPRA